MTAASDPALVHPRESWWSRRLVQPLRRQLTQGVSPEALALTFGVGTACAVFPFLGFTSLLNLGTGAALRLNQPLLQLLNQVLGPAQLALILVYVRAGEWLWRSEDGAFTIGEMLRTFRERSLVEFLERFGWAGVHAFSAWAITSPLLVAMVYFALRPIFRRWQAKR